MMSKFLRLGYFCVFCRSKNISINKNNYKFENVQRLRSLQVYLFIWRLLIFLIFLCRLSFSEISTHKRNIMSMYCYVPPKSCATLLNVRWTHKMQATSNNIFTNRIILNSAQMNETNTEFIYIMDFDSFLIIHHFYRHFFLLLWNDISTINIYIAI